MEDWPEWIVKSLRERFDELSLTIEQQENIAPLIERSSKLLTDLKNRVDESVQSIFLEWEDAVHYQHAVEKEWLGSESCTGDHSLISYLGSRSFQMVKLYPHI